MRAEAGVRLVEVSANRRLFECPDHALGLAVRPGMVELGEAMLNVVLSARQVEGMCAEYLPASEEILNLRDRPAAFRWPELEPVVPWECEAKAGQVLL